MGDAKDDQQRVGVIVGKRDPFLRPLGLSEAALWIEHDAPHGACQAHDAGGCDEGLRLLVSVRGDDLQIPPGIQGDGRRVSLHDCDCWVAEVGIVVE